MWLSARTRVVRTLVACALVCATAFASGADGASSSVVVTADVPSASTLINGCTSAAATQFGAVLPDAGSRTATGVGSVCRLTFGSSNNTSQLRISQSDGTGAAMALGMTPPTLLGSTVFPGRTVGAFGYDANYGWLSGRSSTMYRTLNGGGTWGFPTGTTGNSLDVEVVPGSPEIVFSVGESKLMQRSANGFTGSPATFTNFTAPGWPAGTDINELSIPDNDTMVVVGSDRWIAVYDFSSTAWITSFQHSNASIGNLVAVDAFDANTFIAIDDRGAVLTTTTRGANSAAWTVTALPGSPTTTDIAFGAGVANRAYAIGLDGYVASLSGGAWTDRTAAAGIGFDAMGVDSLPGSPDSMVISDERGGIHRSTDQGATWVHRSTGSSSRTGDISAATATRLYVPAAERTFMSSGDAGNTWNIVGPTSAEHLAGIATSPTNGQRVLAVGGAATWTSTNGGTAWTSTAIAAPGLDGVTLVDDNVGWAVGHGGRILQTTDLGATWAPQTPPAGITERLNDVVGEDRYRATAVGDDGRIIATVNGGSTWVTRTSGTARALTGVDQEGAVLLAVGVRGTILRSSDSGVTWAAVGVVPDATAALVDVAFATATTAYAATTAGAVWRSLDAGVSWSFVGTSGTRARGLAAWGRTVVVTGLADITARSTDGGVTFSPATGSRAMHMDAVAMSDPHTAIIVGADTTRYRAVADATASALVSDWGAPADDWDSGGFFGVCLQAVGGGALADWTADATGVIGECETNGVDPWRALPATGSLAAHTNAAGLGTVDLVWGFRPKTNQAPGTYEAGIAFEAISP